MGGKSPISAAHVSCPWNQCHSIHLTSLYLTQLHVWVTGHRSLVAGHLMRIAHMQPCNGPAKCHYSPHVFPLSVPFPHPVLIRCCKSRSSYDDVKVELKGVHSHFEDVKLELNPAYGEVTPSQAQTEPQPYEEFVAIGGMTSDSVAMEENPAYQSVDTTESQTEEPVYL